MLQFRCQTCLLAIVQLTAISALQASNEAPYFIEEPSDIYVRKGKPASLSCVVGGHPKPAVGWMRDGVPLDVTGDSRRTIKPDGSLHFSQIIHSRDEKPDEGKYQCEALSQISRIVSKTAHVIVAGLSSKVTVVPVTLKVKFGGIARFYCSVKHSVPKALIKWKKKGEPDDITTGGRFTLIPGGALQISNIKFADQGNYECIAENYVTSRSHTSTNTGTIEVLPDRGFRQAPRFVIQPVDTVAIAGSSTVLECAVNGIPKPRITWFHNGTPVVFENQYSFIGESNLKIEPVSVSDAGVYVCHAQGGDGTEETQAELAVHYPPVFTKRPRDIHATEESNGRFECEASGIPKPEILWSRSGDMIENSDYTKVGDGFLLIERLVSADEGVYQCIAKNSLGDIQDTAELFVYKRGEPLPVTTLPPTTTTETTNVTTTTQAATPQRQVPEMPRDVAAWPHSDSEIEITWAPPSVPHGKILRYTIFYSLSGEDRAEVKIVNTSGNNLRKMITNLQPDAKYSFNVFAANKHGTGEISNEAVAKTYPSSHVPKKPVNLEAEAESESAIRVTWMPPDPGSGSISEYTIIYKEADSNSPEMKDVTKQQTRVLRDLKTYTKYTISVFAENTSGGKGASSTVQATTMGGVPQGPPRDFVLRTDSSGTGLIATWNPPDPRKVNGRITYYIIKFKTAESQEENETERIGAQNLQHNIKGLRPSTKYQAKIAAGTDSGLGVFTEDWVEANTNRTECTENSHPGKPEITAEKAFSNMIVIKWAPPDDAGLICVTGYNLGWGERSPYNKTVELDSDKLEYIIRGLKSKQRYVIRLSATNSHGPGEDQQTVIRTLPGGESREVVKGLQTFPLSPKVMQLTWKDPHVSPSVLVTYHVYHSVHNQVKYCGNTTHKAIKCSGLKPYTKYIFYVRRNMEEFNATISNYTDEDKPSSPVDLTGNPGEENFTLLTLHWQPPLRPNGHILQYRIYYSDNKRASDEHWTSVVVDGSRLTQQISGLDPGGTYFFRMQAQTKKGWGPLSEVKEIITLSEAISPGGTSGNTDNVPSAVSPGEIAGNNQPAVGELKNKTLWIVIAAVAGVTLIAIIIISVILCKKRSADDIQRKPPTYKSVIQANGSAKKKHKEEKPPDLWINHTDHVEMKPINPAPDVTDTIPRNSEEMKPLNDSPIDQIALDHERNSFMNGNDTNSDDTEELPPPPVIDSKDEPYPEYIDTGKRTPTPPPSPVISPYRSPRPITPENVRYPVYPMTSTPRYQRVLPRTGSYENALEVPEPRPPQRARSYDPDFNGPSPMVPVFPGRYPISSLPKPRPKPPVAPADDIQLPPVGYSRTRSPNGYWTPPPKYEDIFTRRSPPSSPPRNQEAVVADLDKEIAGLEGLMRDLNEITAVDL